MKKAFIAMMCIAFIVLEVSTYADDNMEEILSSVVKIHAEVPADAYTANALGTEREGNGVIIDTSGTILTIGYLIIEAEDILVTLADGRSVPAAFIGYDYDTGFGLLRIDKPRKTSPMEFGQSSKIKEGDQVLVAGYGGTDAVQIAQIISRSEFVGYWEYLLEDALYIAPPHPNFGGAALVDADGRLVGIGSIYTPFVLEGIGLIPSNMFVPIDLLKPILSELIKEGRPSKPSKPWLGLNVDESHGRIFVIRVTSGGPAESAGIRTGDIILTVDGKAVKGIADFYRSVWSLGNAGINVRLNILQDTEIRKISIKSVDRYQFLKLSPQMTRKGRIVLFLINYYYCGLYS
jgi:S1-C subfamily serine protease